jgi:hypothetical protein
MNKKISLMLSLCFAFGLCGQPTLSSALGQDQSKNMLVLKLIVDGHLLEGSYLPFKASTLTVSPELADKESAKQDQGERRLWVKSLSFKINGGSTLESTGATIAISNFKVRANDKITIFNVKVLSRAKDGSTAEEGGNFPEINLVVR